MQRDPAANQTVVYLPYGEELHLNTTTGVVTGLRYYDKSPDGVTVVRSSTGTVTYELADRLGTATTTVDAGTLAVTRRYVDPYGAARGPAAANWPDQHGYLAQPSDPTTGLDLLGARNYDPTIGRFLSVDPLLEAVRFLTGTRRTGMGRFPGSLGRFYDGNRAAVHGLRPVR